jgi:hypothetical protein
MAQEKSPIQPVGVLPTACLWLPSLKDKSLSLEVGVMYINKTLVGNLRCFYLDENQQEVSMHVLARNFLNNGRFKVLLNGLENATAIAPFSLVDSAELIEIVFKLRRTPIALQFHSEGDVLSVVKRIKHGEIPADVKPEELESVDERSIVQKVSTTEIKFEPAKKDNENSSKSFFSFIKISLFQEKTFSFLQNVFKEESSEGGIRILAETAKANSEDSAFFETLIQQIHQFEETYTVPSDSAENKSGLRNMTQSC